MSPWRRRWRRLRRATALGGALLLILAGLLVALLTQLLPLLQSRPEQVAAWLERQAGVPIALERVSGAWTGRGLRFDIDGLRIGGLDGPRIPNAVLIVRPFTGWWPGQVLSTLQLTGPQLELDRRADGRWQVRGLGVAEAAGGRLDPALIERLGEIVLDGASLRVRSAADGIDGAVERLDARLRSVDGKVLLALQVYVDDAPPLQLQAAMDADLTEGSLYLRARAVPLDRWVQSWWQGERPMQPSNAELDLWFDIAGGRLAGLQFEAALRAVADAPVAGPAMRGDAPALPAPRALRGHWQRQDGGWTLQVEEAGDGRGWLQLRRQGEADTLQAGDWSLAPWWPWLPPHLGDDTALRARLLALAPTAQIDALRVERDAGGAPRYTLRASAAGVAPVGRSPGIGGLALAVEGVGARARLRVQAAPARFDWPSSLREVLAPRIDGELMLWRDQRDGWCLHALQLRAAEADYGIHVEGGLCLGEGGPLADLRVQVDPGPIVAAKKFWIIDRMSPKAVDWLDRALVDGRLAGGQLSLHGALRHWPFLDGGGRFEALALLDGVTLDYLPDWPRGEGLSGVARFVNVGMEVDATARIGDIAISRVRGDFPRFRDARLALELDGRGEGASLLTFLRDTPLWTRLAPGLERVAIQGAADVAVRLDIPLKRELGPTTVDGEVAFDQADLRHAEWGIAFDAARGNVVFSERGLRIDDMAVLHAGRPATFSLAVGSFARSAENLVEARVAGRLDARALIDTQPELDWLTPWLDGVSRWDIALSVPPAASGRVARLALRSDLVGTALQLPAPMRKSAAVALPLQLDIALDRSAKPVELRLGELLQLSGVLRPGEPFNGVAAFGETTAVERPERGLRVVGQVAVLDGGGWMGLASGAGDGLLQSLDLRCGDLDLFGRGFGETRLRYTQDGGARTVRFEGARLDGEVLFPAPVELLQRGVTARFARLHWPAKLGGDSEPNPDSGIVPATLPALHVEIDDLRLGDAVLGKTRLETWPQAEGMHIDQFSARSPALELSARGDWTRIDGIERSRFNVEFTAQDLGGMLTALGFAGFVEGGQTLATLEGEWPGSPSSFALANVVGTLAVSVGQGRVPDVDPGAGRLFGLLSLSEIPRRLALDFSDFFRSGLAFNRIEGQFRLDGGSAHTDRLLIDGPAAEIVIRGRTGLREQDYAQTMEVLPRAGSVLPVVGAIAGGPAGAAIGAVAQAVLQRPFKQITRTLYSVNGPWKQPVIDVLERGPRRSPQDPAGEPPVPGP
jgi:uncharacterized protein (TIGR02099 family)